MKKPLRAESTTVPDKLWLKPHELGIHSFGRITFDGTKMHFPRELGDGYQRKEFDAKDILEKVDAHYNKPGSETPKDYEFGRKTLETFLTKFSVPRPTNGESPMQLSMFEWANNNGFHCEVDTVGNIAVVIPGRKDGKIIDITDPENVGDIVVLQHHLDKVSVAKEGSGKHPNTEPVDVEVFSKENDLWIQAKNKLTTLGADNGGGGSVMWEMAEHYAHSKEKNLPTIVVLATVGEEGTTDGAQNISFAENNITSHLLKNAKVIINNDHESPTPDPEVIIGSYGLELFETTYTPGFDPIDTEHYDLVELNISGLTGGHSGLFPDKTSAGIVLINQLKEVLHDPSKTGWRLCSLVGGEKHNQIAQNAHAVIAIPKGAPENIRQQLETLSKPIDPKEHAFSIHADDPKVMPTEMLNAKSTEDVFALLSDYASQQGANKWFFYEKTQQNLFDRSFNIGEVNITPHDVRLMSSSRVGIQFSEDDERQFGKYEPFLKHSAELHGAQVKNDETLPTWHLDTTDLSDMAADAYENMPGKPEQFPHLGVKIVTGGLEVAFFQDKFPKAKQLVFAMNITDIHNPGEALNVSSFFTNVSLMKEFLDKLFARMHEDAQRTRRG